MSNLVTDWESEGDTVDKIYFDPDTQEARNELFQYHPQTGLRRMKIRFLADKDDSNEDCIIVQATTGFDAAAAKKIREELRLYPTTHDTLESGEINIDVAASRRVAKVITSWVCTQEVNSVGVKHMVNTLSWTVSRKVTIDGKIKPQKSNYTTRYRWPM